MGKTILFKSIRWSPSVYLLSIYFTGLSPSGFLSFDAEGGETQTCRPKDDLITEMKDWETIKDKRIKEMARLKEESLRHRLNCSLYQTTFWETPSVMRTPGGLLIVLGVQLFSLHLAPNAFYTPELSVTNTLPQASPRPSHAVRAGLVAMRAGYSPIPISCFEPRVSIPEICVVISHEHDSSFFSVKYLTKCIQKISECQRTFFHPGWLNTQSQIIPLFIFRYPIKDKLFSPFFNYKTYYTSIRPDITSLARDKQTKAGHYEKKEVWLNMLSLTVCFPSLLKTVKSFVTLNVHSKLNCFNSASVVMAFLEFELTEWQGRMLRCSVLVNNKYHWSQDEGWGDFVAKEGNRWLYVKSQQTELCSGVNLKPLWAETLFLLRQSGFTEIHTQQKDGKEWGEKARREWGEKKWRNEMD